MLGLRAALLYLALTKHLFMTWEMKAYCNDEKPRLLKYAICITCKTKHICTGHNPSGIEREEQNGGKVRIPSNPHFTEDNLNIYSHTNSPLKN